MSFFFIDDAGGVSSTTYVGTAESTGASITIPVGAQAGDIAVFYDVGYNSSGTPSLVTPSGWANRVNSTLSTLRAAVFTKTLESGDPGASITGMDGTFADAKQMLVFRPNTLATLVSYSTFTTEFTSGNPSAQIAAASGQVPPAIILGGCAYGASMAFSTASPAFDAQIAPSHDRTRMGYKLYSDGASPADHTIDMNDLGSLNHLWAGYITLT